MQIESNLTEGKNITLDSHENSGMLPVELATDIHNAKIKKVTIEYVTADDKHYLVTQYYVAHRNVCWFNYLRWSILGKN